MSSSKIYQAPFHRRILPWLYLSIFIVASPILVFYTSGYRYNPKKQIIEKNGDLILDSLPKGAHIWLDDNATNYKTPVNIQDVTPGMHKVRIESPDRVSWEKTLEVKAERVTFADSIILWKKNPSANLLQSFQQGFFTNGIDQEPMGLIYQASSTITLEERDAEGNTLKTLTLPDLIWNNLAGGTLAKQGAFLDEKTKDGTHNIFQLNPSLEQVTTTKEEVFPFQDSFLKNNAVFSTKQKDFEDQSLSGYRLEKSADTNQEILRDESFFDTRYLLPAGEWHFAYVNRPYVLLHAGNEWLGINVRARPLTSAMLTGGDRPRWLSQKDIPEGLFLTQNEIWLWRIGEEPELLLRQSKPFIQVQWHPLGKYIFYTDGQTIYSLEMDDRNGRIVSPLIDFDTIQDFIYQNNSLYVIGTRAGETGLWQVPIE